MTAHTAALGFLTPKDFVVLDYEGKVVSGEGRPSTETKLHTAVYRDTEAGAVVHLHPPYTNVLALSHRSSWVLPHLSLPRTAHQ